MQWYNYICWQGESCCYGGDNLGYLEGVSHEVFWRIKKNDWVLNLTQLSYHISYRYFISLFYFIGRVWLKGDPERVNLSLLYGLRP